MTASKNRSIPRSLGHALKTDSRLKPGHGPAYDAKAGNDGVLNGAKPLRKGPKSTIF